MSLLTQYARPRQVGDVPALLNALGSGVMLIAGGQELMPFINHARLMPSVLVDISGLKELRKIELQDDGSLSIGALTVHRALQEDTRVGQHAPLLADAASRIGGGWQVQNRATIGGNIVCMHPLYDLVPSLLALNASVETLDVEGVKVVRLAEVLIDSRHGLGTTSILTRVILPPATESGWAYEKLMFTAGSYGSANAAATAQLEPSGAIAALTLVIGAVTEQPLDLSDALEDWIGRPPDHALLAQLPALVDARVRTPLSDQKGDGEYRRAMAGVVARRAMSRALERATGNSTTGKG